MGLCSSLVPVPVLSASVTLGLFEEPMGEREPD